MNNNQLETDLNEKNKLLLDNFLSSVISTLDTEDIYDTIQNTLVELLHPEGLLLMFNEPASHIYQVTRTYGSIFCPKDYCVPGNALISELSSADSLQSPAACSDSIRAAITSRKKKWLKEQNISAFYSMKYGRAIIGFIFIANKNLAPLSELEVTYLNKICYYASYVLRNANLYQNAYRASITDDLTSMYNRKYAFEYIESLCYQQQPYTLLLFDIDDFKLYNELYGAKEGDNLLAHFAKFLLRELAPTDMAFRYGTDEFLILKTGNDVEGARVFAQNILDKIADYLADTVWDITVTCGISAFPLISKDANSFFHNCEQAVYYGKLDGKGQITVYQSGMEERSENPDIQAAYERIAPTIYALTAAIDAKDNYTFIHSSNVSKYAVILAESLGMNNSDIEIIRDAGLLHDIGKIGIPEHILKKTSRLTSEEYTIMKTHVENSTKMIRYLPDMDYVIPAVVGHHERYDGNGYPRGLAGENIPYMARILTIADCFDAMTARRPYKQALSVDYAINELENNSGTQFDPKLAKQFIKLIHDGKIVVEDTAMPMLE